MEAAMPLQQSPSPLTAVPLSHRRVHSELSFRLPDEINLVIDPFDVPSPNSGGGDPTAAVDEDHDDLLASYLELETIAGGDANHPDGKFSLFKDDNSKNEKMDVSYKIRHSRSVDGFCVSSIDNGSNNYFSNKMNRNIASGDQAKKAMPPEKLAELSIIDPKRAKRILANRQSAARSKERKARYIVELEKKVQSLQTEATALSVQLSFFERDTTSLTGENTDLRRQLESMEQQAQLRDALIDALKQEVDRLKAATGEATTPSDSLIVPIQNIPYNSQPPPPKLVDSHQSQLLPLYPLESNSHQIDTRSEKVSHFPSFETNLTCAPQVVNSSSTTISHFMPFSNMISMPQPSKYPVDTSLYLPLDSSTLQFHKIDTNAAIGSSSGNLPQYPFDSNTMSRQQEAFLPSHSQMLAQMMSQDQQKLQGLDIGGRGQCIIANEGVGGF